MNPNISKSNVDRRVIPLDDKQRILDLSGFNLSLPAVGIYDEPTRCYRANIEWAKIIEGFIDWLAEIAVWKDAEDESYIGVQEILKFLEGVDCDMPIDCQEVEECLQSSPTIIDIQTEISYLESKIMTMSEDVCAGVICALEEMAQRILLSSIKENLISDISIGKDNGEITIKNPVVDPDEDVDAPFLELLNGQTYAVGLGFKEFMETINQAYTEGLTAAQLARRICTLYEMNTDQDDLDFQNVLFDYLQELVSYTFVPNPGDLSQIVWTYGSKVSSIVRYVLSLEAPVPQSVVDVLELLVPYISATQVSLWYSAGKGQPRLDYLNYPDYRQPSKTYILTVEDFGATITSIERVQFFLEAISKPIGNRWQYKFSGHFTNTATGQILDAFYYTNVNTTINNGMTTGADNNGSSRSFEAKPAYKENHQYAAYRTNGVAEKLTGVFMQFMPAWDVADVEGAITVTITDLGVQ